MATPDITFGAGVAFATQTNQASVDTTLRDETTPILVSEGLVLGVASAGVGETGISIPTHLREALARPDVGGSLTKQANSFLRTQVDGFQVAFELKGNGATATNPVASGEAKPDPGIDALVQAATQASAAGSSPVWEYTPLGEPKYLTAKLWVAGQSFVYAGCVVENLSFAFVGGEGVIVTATIRVGSLNTAAEVALPVFTYGNQLSLSAPILETAAFTWNAQVRGAADVTLEIANEIVEFPDMNVVGSGKRLQQKSQTISMNGTIYMHDANDDFEHTELIRTDAPTADASWRLGIVSVADAVMNGVLVNVNNLQVTSVTYEDAGDVTLANVQTHVTDTVAGNEFTLTWD